jgi:hypothetical protein
MFSAWEKWSLIIVVAIGYVVAFLDLFVWRPY